ncbi:MAG TPA: zinc metallopeptidase [Thermomicrobiales bacterium]|jgi:Zn-dependent membrane protease YugP
MFFIDPTYLLFILPGLIFSLWAQSKVRGTYQRYNRVPNSAGATGAQAAREVLNSQGLYDVQIEPIPGELTDHYDPRTRVLRLSQGVYNVRSIAAIGIAAHEAGHAVQHAKSYAPLKLRTAIVPAVNIGSQLGFILLLVGLFIAALRPVAWVGVGMFALSTVFALITLPVEFDASRRAKVALAQVGLVDGGVGGGEEARGVAAVLSAAAWTYIAGFVTSLLQLLYWLSLLTGNSRRSN